MVPKPEVEVPTSKLMLPAVPPEALPEKRARFPVPEVPAPVLSATAPDTPLPLSAESTVKLPREAREGPRSVIELLLPATPWVHVY